MLRAHQLNSKYLFCSCFNVAGYLFISFPFMVEIFVCFPSRTSFPFQVSRYTCSYSFSLQLYNIIFKSLDYLPVYLLLTISFTCARFLCVRFFLCSNHFNSASLYVCTIQNLDIVLKQMRNFNHIMVVVTLLCARYMLPNFS